MSKNHKILGMEIADERHFEDTTVIQMQEASESQFLDLGTIVLKIPSRFPRRVHRRWLTVSTDSTPTG